MLKTNYNIFFIKDSRTLLYSPRVTMVRFHILRYEKKKSELGRCVVGIPTRIYNYIFNCILSLFHLMHANTDNKDNIVLLLRPEIFVYYFFTFVACNLNSFEYIFTIINKVIQLSGLYQNHEKLNFL